VDFHDERGGDFRIHTFKTIPVGTDVHFVWLFSDAGDNVRRNVYHAVDDTTAHSRRAQDGTPLSTPISRAEADAECLVFDSHARGEDTNQHRVDLDERDNPHVLFTHANDGTWEYRYAHWNGTEWTAPETIATIGAPTDDAVVDDVRAFTGGTLRVRETDDVTAYPVSPERGRAGA